MIVRLLWIKLNPNLFSMVFRFQGLDKIEVEMEITENLREYKTSKDSKLFDKDFNGP